MSQRAYGQYCGVARALDILGERWTILILRDLLPGPLRYTDLATKQPAMSSDLLSARLRSLEHNDIIRRRELIPPGGVNVYEITEKALESVLAITSALARFGTPHLSDPVETDGILDPAWALTSLTQFKNLDPPDGSGLHVVSERGSVRIRKLGKSTAVRYCSPDGADVVVSGESRPVMAVLTGRLTPDQAQVSVHDPDHRLRLWIRMISSAGLWSSDPLGECDS